MKRFGKKAPKVAKRHKPEITPRKDHAISRNNINPNALKVLYRLHNSGYSAYLVGGCVRDLLLGRIPKDFDVATNALPEEVRRVFKNCRIIGKRFRLAHIVFGKEIIEVATFRTHHENASSEHHAKMHKGMIVRDNVFGLIEDDAWRRDFTINALYYNIADYSIVDYTHGMQDIHEKVLRVIGNPEKRFLEDPVRLLRAIRISGKLHLNIAPETETAIIHHRHLLREVSNARLFQEVLKFFQEGATLSTFKLLEKYQVLEELFPKMVACFKQESIKQFIENALIDADQRTQMGKTVSPVFLFTVFLWPPIEYEAKNLEKTGLPRYVALEKSIQTTLKAQMVLLAMPRNLQTAIREIGLLQHRFHQRHGTRAYRLLTHPRFRAAYDLLQLRAKTEEPLVELAEWWIKFSESDTATRTTLLKTANNHSGVKKHKQGRYRRRHKEIH